LFIKSQLTKNGQGVLCLSRCTHVHVWSWTAAHFQRSSGGCKWLNRHEKWACEESLYIKLKLNTLVFLNVPTDKSLKGLRSGEHGGCYSKTICRYILMLTFFLVLVWGTHSWNFSKHILYIPCTQFTNVAVGRITQRDWRPQVGHLVLNNHSPLSKAENSHHYVSHARKDRTVMTKRWKKASTGSR
jgi:hypothetical protein